MREYELTVIYDLTVAEGGGPDAAVTLLTNAVEARGGKLLKVDHWGRRRGRDWPRRWAGPGTSSTSQASLPRRDCPARCAWA